ncbi:coiled-coil domain-containing protein 86 isoform X1 [Calonectris borealis]|uniref:coiled-coil domain-containing protein 86 isoform X1 n=1 Tax=Calonectris borealis TaxID=1323832 RepID=UPI003F4B63DD
MEGECGAAPAPEKPSGAAPTPTPAPAPARRRRKAAKKRKEAAAAIPRGRPKSGRVWKDPGKKRFSHMIQDKALRTSWARKMKERQEKKLVQDLARQLQEGKQREREGRVAESGRDQRLSTSVRTKPRVSACIPRVGAVALLPAGCLPHKPHRPPFSRASGTVNSLSSCQIQAATVTCCESLSRNKLAQSVQASCRGGEKRCWLGFVQQISRLGRCRSRCCSRAVP